MIVKYLQSNKIVERVNVLNMGIILVMLVLISVVATLTMTMIARTASMRIAYIYSLESLAKFNLYAHGELALLRKAAQTAAVQEWFANEHNPEKKLAAFNELMNFASSFQNPEFYFGIVGSLNEYAVDLDTTFESFSPYSRMTEGDPMDAWFFELIDSDNDFLFNIDVDKVAHRWRIWVNHKVVHEGQVVGVLCISLRIDDVINSVFGHYDGGYVSGFVIDNRGFIHAGSATLVHYSELEDELIHISSINAALGNFVEDFVGRNELFFNAGSRPEVIRLPGIVSNYAAIAPIANSDWMIITLFSSNALFSMVNLLPLVAVLVSALIVYMFISTAVMRRYVLNPLTSLTESVSQISEAGTEDVAVYGGGRKDEIGDLARTIQHMWFTLRARNIDLHTTTKELTKLEKLLQTVNSAATVLLAVSDRDSFRDILLQSVEIVGRCLEADRVQLWRADLYPDGVGITLGYQWLSELGQQNPQAHSNQKIPYGVLLKWEATLLNGEYYNGPVADLPAAERHFMEQMGNAKSIVIIPVFLYGKLWGFCTIADCVNERTLSNDEVNILRSAFLMMASTYQRVELAAAERDTHELNQAIFDAAPYVIGLWDENGKIISASKQSIKTFGISDPQVIIDELFCISPEFQPCGTPSPIKAAEQIKRTFMEDLVRFDWMHKTAAGEPLPCECTFMRFTHKGKDMLLSYTRDLREIKAAEKLALTDALTGVGNRRCLMETAEQELQNCIEKNMNFAIIMIDIDHFKLINDRHGHAIGDAVLKILTLRIRHVLKQETLVTRYGGEEFAIALSGLDHETAINTAWRIQKTIEASAFRIGDLEINVTASFGVASKTSGCTTLSDIIDRADKALYQAKRTGRNTVVGYNPG